MRRTLTVAGISLAVHIALYILLGVYRDWGSQIGMLFPHGHDISDIPVVELKGFAVLAIAVVVLGVIAERSWKWFWPTE